MSGSYILEACSVTKTSKLWDACLTATESPVDKYDKMVGWKFGEGKSK